MIIFFHRTMFGTNTPSWMTASGFVHVHKHVQDKYVHILEINFFHTNQNYAAVQLLKAHKVTVFAQDTTPTSVDLVEVISPGFHKAEKFHFPDEKVQIAAR